MRQGSIPRCFTWGVMKLLRKDKHGGEGISNFCHLTMLNTDLKILVKILADCLQTVLPNLICPEPSCALKVWTIQDSLHKVCTIVEKVNRKDTLIILDQSKAFDRVDHGFLETVLSAAGFRPHFRSWICLLYVSPGVMVEENGVRSRIPYFDLFNSSKLSAIADALRSYARTFLVQVKDEPSPTQPHVTWFR